MSEKCEESHPGWSPTGSIIVRAAENSLIVQKAIVAPLCPVWTQETAKGLNPKINVFPCVHYTLHKTLPFT